MNASSQSLGDAGRTTRRSLLGAAIGAAALTGCGGGFADSGGGGRGAGGDKPAGQQGGFSIPDPPDGFPTDDVTFRLVDSNDTKAPYWEQLFAAYQKKFPNVKVTYDGLPWNRIEEVVPLGFRNGSAHDLLQLPPTIPLTQAVGEGWVAPFDDVIPDFDSWQQQLPETAKVDGVQVFDGKLYSIPIASDQRYFCGLHYSRKLLNNVGFDPQTEPLTWDTFREAARKVTEKGQGRAYGFVLEGNQPPRLEVIVNYLARMAGLKAVADIAQPSGEFCFTADEIIEAIDLLLALKSDGSLFPGSNSLTAPETWPRVARGNAAMVAAGPWVTVLYENENPDFDFGVARMPAPGPDPLPNGYSPMGADALNLAATSKVKEVAGHLMSYVISPEGQTRWGEIAGVGNPPILEQAREASVAGYSEQGKACAALAEQMTANPVPEIANPDTALALRREKLVTPDFGEVIQAILVGEVKDVRKAMADLKDRAEKHRDDAITLAEKRDGSTATRQDWVFRNWDPRKDYTTADYEKR